MCLKCERMIMLDPEYATGFCLYCGTHIAYDEAREFFLDGLKSAVPDDLKLEADLCELIDEDDSYEDVYGADECREECDKAQAAMGKWSFAEAFQHYTAALEWRPGFFEASCGRLTTGILKLNDVENWEQRLSDCVSLIRSQPDWNMAQRSLEYALDILQKFLSKGGRFVSPTYTYGFFSRLTESFPTLRERAAVILAHCVNVDVAPFTDAARLDHETTRFAVGSYPQEPDKELSRFMLLIMKYHPDTRARHSLIRAVYVFDRAVWLRNHDEARIEDMLTFMEKMSAGGYSQEDIQAVQDAGFDFLMMGALEPASTAKEKLLFLSGIYNMQQMKRMERFFSHSAFFYRVYMEVCLKKGGAGGILSAEYKRLRERLKSLTD